MKSYYFTKQDIEDIAKLLLAETDIFHTLEILSMDSPIRDKILELMRKQRMSKTVTQ